MRQFNFIQSRRDAQWGFQLNDGRIIEVINKAGKFLLSYDTPINLTTGEIGEKSEYTPTPKKTEEIPAGFTTLNILMQTKQGKTVYCYDEYDIDLGHPKIMTIRKAVKLAKEFMKHGFNVSSTAIMHNFEAWKAGGKSGYRDEKRGTHLFTPSGCNAFSLRATTLEECCKEWQITYIC